MSAMEITWYTLYAFVVGREGGDSPRYWFSSYVVLPQPSTDT